MASPVKHKYFPSKRAARRAAFREAGIGKHGQSKYISGKYLNKGSRHPFKGSKQIRHTWKSPRTGRRIVHDKWGHNGNTFAHSHYGMYDIDGSEIRYYYPTRWNPLNNR